MRIRLFVILIMLIAIYPFIGGAKGGCSGAIELPGEDLGELSIDTATPGPGGEGMVETGEEPSGVENILNPVEESSVSIEEPSTRVPVSATLLPSGANLYLIEDLSRINDEDSKESIEKIGFDERLLYTFKEGLKAAGVKEDLLPSDKLTSVSAACLMPDDYAKRDVSTISRKTSSNLRVDSAAIERSRFSFLLCKDYIINMEFSEDFDMPEFAADKMAMKPIEGVLAVGTKGFIDKMKSIESEKLATFSKASPSSLILLAESTALKAFQYDPMFRLFEPMFKYAKIDFEARVLSVIDFVKDVKMSTAIFEKQNEEQAVIKIFLEMSYYEYASSVTASLSKVDATRKVEEGATRETIEESTITSTRTPDATAAPLESATDVESTKQTFELSPQRKIVEPSTDNSMNINLDAEQPERRQELQGD